MYFKKPTFTKGAKSDEIIGNMRHWKIQMAFHMTLNFYQVQRE